MRARRWQFFFAFLRLFRVITGLPRIVFDGALYRPMYLYFAPKEKAYSKETLSSASPVVHSNCAT